MKQNYPLKTHSFKQKILLLLLFFSPLVMLAQTRLITGRVIGGTTKDPMPGVGITIKGTQRGTNTDAAGNFKIDASPSETLVFSFIGYVAQEIKVGNSSIIEVNLLEDTQALEEVVV